MKIAIGLGSAMIPVFNSINWLLILTVLFIKMEINGRFGRCGHTAIENGRSFLYVVRFGLSVSCFVFCLNQVT